MVGNIDNTYNYFNDTVNQSGLSFTNITYTDIQTFVPDHSIVILDVDGNPLAYVQLTSITSIYRTGLIITINEETLGKIFIEFINTYNVDQGYSMLMYLWNNLGKGITVNTNPGNIYVDSLPPVVYFYSNVGNTASGYTISLSGATSSPPYNTSMGYTFSTTLVLSNYGTLVPTPDLVMGSSSVAISSLLINDVVDNYDGVITIDNTNIILKNEYYSRISSITQTGTYSVSFNIYDYANNGIDPSTIVILSII